MFNLSLSHMVLILIVALIFIGPQQLPEVARSLGRLLNELRRASSDLTQTFWDAKNSASEAAHLHQSIAPPPTEPVPPAHEDGNGSQPPPQTPT